MPNNSAQFARMSASLLIILLLASGACFLGGGFFFVSAKSAIQEIEGLFCSS
jgi:hypothetical protein